jgi:hypothetical protein
VLFSIIIICTQELQELTQSSISSHQPAVVTAAVSAPENNSQEPMDQVASDAPAPQVNGSHDK